MQQILKVDIDWETLGKLRDLSDDDYIALRDALELPELPPLDAKDTAIESDSKNEIFGASESRRASLAFAASSRNPSPSWEFRSRSRVSRRS